MAFKVTVNGICAGAVYVPSIRLMRWKGKLMAEKNNRRRGWQYGVGLINGLSLAVLFAAPALAHEEMGDGVGFVTGLLHPVLGFDHLLAMLSVGILSAQMGGRAIWYVPATFVGAMILGGYLGMAEIALPMVEAGIALSVLALGAAVATDRNLPTGIAEVCVAVFGVFHGHAHGTEMPLIADPWLYGLGFVIGTATIHLTGVFIGFAFRRFRNGPGLLRYVGAGIAGIGSYILIGG
jgi:urease accessory protein